MNEEQTKFEYVELALSQAGWQRGREDVRILKEFAITQGRLIGQGRRSQPLKADYVLEYKNKRLAVVEAKSIAKSYTDGVAQAKDYAKRLDIRFTYATNGKQIYQIDMLLGRESLVEKFPSPDELWEMTFSTQSLLDEAEFWQDKFCQIAFEEKGGTWKMRYYQENAVNKVLGAISQDKKRILLTLATGTGKTAIAFQIAWKLFKARWTLQKDGKRQPRILFLADRNILATQALNKFNNFSIFPEDALVRISPQEIRKKGRVPTNASIFFTIFQTFMTNTTGEEEQEENITKEEEVQYNFGQYPKDFFDFIIIDECHRGGANEQSTWRGILEYFSPAVQLGLTATPRRDVNGDTYDYFGNPVYIYSLKEGIEDGYLTPFQVKEIFTTIDEYTHISDNEVLEGEVEVGENFSKDDFSRGKIRIDARTRKRVKELLRLMNQNQKTIVFCRSQEEAGVIRDYINQICESNNPDYCHRVTAQDGKLGEQKLEDFQDNEKNIPTILTTSQKLSTGVDARDVRNIVLMRRVNSMVEFKQIIGRGTRVFEGKDYFTIYDFEGNSKKFSEPDWDGDPDPPDKPDPFPEPSEPDEKVADDDSCQKPEKQMVIIKLSKGNEVAIDSMVRTNFLSPEGKPISTEEYLRRFFDDLANFFKNEEELREIYSNPESRQKFFENLEKNGYSYQQLEELKKVINAQDSDLFDVLNYIAYQKEFISRFKRAEQAKEGLKQKYNERQQEFISFILSKYEEDGEKELSLEKLKPLICLKYQSIADAQNKLGDISSIRNCFINFQRHLYQSQVA